MLPTYYPVNDYDPLMKGLIIGGMGIFHVFLAQFAIGGGLLMCYFQKISTKKNAHPAIRQFLDGYFKALVLISFVLGAVTGVGMWFTSVQIGPHTIGLMIDHFHWFWATEWIFFCIEVVAGYTYYRYHNKLDQKTAFRLLALYSFAAWASLFWINGILSWQLTPGNWLVSKSVWEGFFNPSFWPSLIYRTTVSMTIAALVACLVVNLMSSFGQEAKKHLINKSSHFLAVMIPMPIIGLWYLAVLPDDSKSWIMGGSVAMTMFMALAVATSTLIGIYAVAGLLFKKLYINGPTALLLVTLAFAATAGGEFVREGVRKPYTIRGALYSNSVTPQTIQYLRKNGSVTNDPYPLQNAAQYPNKQLRLGQKVYRMQCNICHTMAGANSLTHLTGSWTLDQMRLNIAKLQYTKSFMPPFAGNAAELEALVQSIAWHNAGKPPDWPESNNPLVLESINQWLTEAGTEPGDFERYKNLPQQTDNRNQQNNPQEQDH